MRSKDRIATAVRIPSGEIKIKTEPYDSFTKRYKILGLPIVRGAVSFVEMLIIGIKTLNFSADIAVKEMDKVQPARRWYPVEHVCRLYLVDIPVQRV